MCTYLTHRVTEDLTWEFQRITEQKIHNGKYVTKYLLRARRDEAMMNIGKNSPPPQQHQQHQQQQLPPSK